MPLHTSSHLHASSPLHTSSHLHASSHLIFPQWVTSSQVKISAIIKGIILQLNYFALKGKDAMLKSSHPVVTSEKGRGVGGAEINGIWKIKNS